MHGSAPGLPRAARLGRMEHLMTDLVTQQAAMNRAYADGAPGVLVSGLVWIASGIAMARTDIATAFAVLFFGGMAIHPLATAVARFVLRCPAYSAPNPLNRLAGESTVILFAGIAVAYALLAPAPALALPAFALVMAARYFVFRTLYDNVAYWVLGGCIAGVAGLALFGKPLPLGNVALQVGIIEIVFAAILFARWRRAAG